MKDSLDRPPLFVRASSPDGREEFQRVERNGSSIGKQIAPGWMVEVIAPSGASIRFTVAEEHDTIHYKDLHALFIADERRGLWKRIKPWTDLARPDAREKVGICPCHSSTPLEDTTRFEPRSIDGLAGVRLDAKHTSILAWCQSGVATLNRSTEHSFVFHAPNLSGHTRKLRTIVLPENAYPTAYWMFSRNGYPKASENLGLALIEEFQRKPSTIYEDDCYVLADFLINFGSARGGENFADLIFNQLAQFKSVDSAILRFCLLSYGLVRPQDTEEFDLFQIAVTGLARQQCQYTELFRLFLARLDSAQKQFEREIAKSSHLGRALKDVMRLAACVYWDGVFLAYRASEPGVPDPEACGSDVHVAAKKKSVFE